MTKGAIDNTGLLVGLTIGGIESDLTEQPGWNSEWTIIDAPDWVEVGKHRLVEDEWVENTDWVEAPFFEIKYYSKAFLFMAMTDEEYTQFEAGLSLQSPRNQAIFANATQLESNHPLTTLLINSMEAAYGAERTRELLTAACI